MASIFIQSVQSQRDNSSGVKTHSNILKFRKWPDCLLFHLILLAWGTSGSTLLQAVYHLVSVVVLKSLGNILRGQFGFVAIVNLFL